jgi:hypothetical protein
MSHFQVTIKISPTPLRRTFQIIKAFIKCHIHCLYHGLAGHHYASARDRYGRIILIAAVSGSIHRGSLSVERVFFVSPA